ncbi:hypothetical protein SUGI_0548580 [Cryptomeria japonica]|nr:hypothetical protein SUGI_0548580 [Cryptomeria japonica]
MSQVTTAVFYIAHSFVKMRRKTRKENPPVHLKERTLVVVEIQDTAPQQEAVFVVVDRLPDADLRLNQSLVTSSRIKSITQAVVALVVRCFTLMFVVRRGEDEGRSAVELVGPEQTTVSNEENPDSIVVDQLKAREHQLEESPISSDYTSVIQVALVFVGGSFAAMYAVLGGVNEAGRAVMGNTVGFIVFLIMDMVALLAALAVAMILVTASRLSPKVDYFIRINLWVAGGSLILSFHAAAYVVVLAKHKWAIMCFGGVVAIAFALLILYRLSTMFHQVSRTSIVGNRGMLFLDRLDGGHFSRDSTRGGQIIKRGKI